SVQPRQSGLAAQVGRRCIHPTQSALSKRDSTIGRLSPASGQYPCEVKRMAIEGDLAFIHVRYLNWGGKEHAGVDIFRFDSDGRILEHWDVLQPVPETASNVNTMF